MAEDHRQNEITLIFGKKGGGKSTRAWQMAKSFPKRIYLDPMFQVKDAVIARDFQALSRYIIAARPRGQFSVALRTLDPSDELRVVELLLHGDPDNPLFPGTLLVVDEMDRLCSPSDLPVPMHRLANYSRHFGVSVIGIARSPKKIHPDFRRNADVFLVGELHEPADVDYLNEYTGSTWASKARQVRDYDFLRWPEAAGS